jgi:hypothetical protein
VLALALGLLLWQYVTAREYWSDQRVTWGSSSKNSGGA